MSCEHLSTGGRRGQENADTLESKDEMQVSQN
jgi:hypothetical protein